MGDAGQGDAVIGQDVLVVLGVLQHLFTVDRFQPGFELRQHRVARQLPGDAGGGVGERDIARFAGLDRQRDADDAGGERVEAGGFGIERGEVGGVDPRQPGVEPRPGEDRFVIDRQGFARRSRQRPRRAGSRRGRGGRSGVQFAQPGPESVAAIEFAQGFRVAGGWGQRGRRRQIRQVAGDGDQFPAQRQEAEMIAQLLAGDAADFAGVGNDSVERAILLQPLDGGLRAALRNPRHAIDRVADQRQIIDDAVRRDAELVNHPGFVEQLVAHRVDPADSRRDELGQVLVARRNQRIDAVDRGVGGQRADHVVGLDAVDHQQRPAGGLDGGMDGRDLADQILGHGRAVGLVFGVPVVTEGLAPGVEDDGLVVRLVVALQPA